MTIQLPEDLERIVRDAVRAGHYADGDDVIRDALMRLQAAMPRRPRNSSRGRRQTQPAPATSKAAPSAAELDRYMVSLGLISQLPNPAEDVDDDDPEDRPVTITGEPLSETIIRERR